MNDTRSRSIGATIVAVLTLCAGLAAFLVPLQHAGPYGIPGRGLVGGLLCFVIAGVLFARGTPTMVRILAFVASPVVLFFALYGAFAEAEEVVVLYAQDAELRLWIVDHEGAEWVSMPRSKAERYAIDGARLELLRAGETRCVIPRIVDDPVANRRTFDLREEKYAVQRLGGVLGMFGDGPGPETITLRLDPCG
ncbi:hypothetical protein KJ059_05295 [Myxococcota bacterium]|nr:hypothetical protein [Myxococcota bacterium]MCZ7618689.1 hypothetical protein [Myxococcota bacterium]